MKSKDRDNCFLIHFVPTYRSNKRVYDYEHRNHNELRHNSDNSEELGHAFTVPAVLRGRPNNRNASQGAKPSLIQPAHSTCVTIDRYTTSNATKPVTCNRNRRHPTTYR